ncbi:MAG: PilW family protein [Candidatus Saccharimonadales bacterium]
MTHRGNQHQNLQQTGFTLVELLLALAFVAFVLIFAITATIQVMRTYNKGLAVKEINQTARATVEDMVRIGRSTSPSVLNTSTINDGRVCFGGVSYVWNFTDRATNVYADDGRVVFARVNDAGGTMCNNQSGSYPKVDRDDATELLTGRVWVHDVDVSLSAGNLIDISLQLSTADDPGSPALEPDPIQGVVCKADTSGQFCAVARFSTTVAIRGEG